MTQVQALRCRECGREYDVAPIFTCEWCFGPLEVTYDYEAIKASISRESIAAGPLSIWRYADLLPVDRNPAVDLGADGRAHFVLADLSLVGQTRQAIDEIGNRVAKVDGLVLWANLHLLFWLSLVPFTTAWMGENHFATIPVSAYGIILLAAAVAYFLLQTMIVRQEGEGSPLGRALGRDWKGKASPLLYSAGILTTYANRWVGVAFYVLVALMWLVPDRRLETLIVRGRVVD